MKMNTQYFSFDSNTQTSMSHASTISSFVSDAVDFLGEKFSSEARASSQSQINSQHSKHDIAGTLVIAVSCTHKNAQVFASLYFRCR